MILSVLLGIGIFLFAISLFKGNLLVLAGPVALWIGVLSFPNQKKAKTVKSRIKSRKKNAEQKQSKLNLLIPSIVIVWLLAFVSFGAKIVKPTEIVDDKEIAKAIEKAGILFQEGEYEQALAAFEAINIPEIFPSRLAQKYHNIGLIQLKLEQSPEVAFKKAIYYDPLDFDAYYILINLAYESQRYSEAQKYLEQAKSQLQEGESLPEQFKYFEEMLKLEIK